MGMLDETTILDVLEGYYGTDINEVARKFATEYRAIGEHARRRLKLSELREVLDLTWAAPLYERQQAGESLLPPLTPGEIRVAATAEPYDLVEATTVATGDLGDVLALAKPPSHWDAEAVVRAARRHLLYAHSIVIDNQLDEFGFRYAKALLRDTVAWLQVLSALGPLIRERIVYVTPTPNLLSVPLRQSNAIISGSAGLSKEQHRSNFIERHFAALADNWMNFTAARYIFLDGHLYMPGSMGSEEPPILRYVFRNLQGREYGSGRVAEREIISTARARAANAIAFERLGHLALPGLTRIGLNDIINVRTDDRFVEFRTTLRNALRDVESASTTSEMEAAFADHMTSAKLRLERSISSGALGRIAAPELLGWAISALVGYSVADWKGALLAGIAGQTTAQLLIDRTPSASDKAPLMHFIATEDKGLEPGTRALPR